MKCNCSKLCRLIWPLKVLLSLCLTFSLTPFYSLFSPSQVISWVYWLSLHSLLLAHYLFSPQCSSTCSLLACLPVCVFGELNSQLHGCLAAFCGCRQSSILLLLSGSSDDNQVRRWPPKPTCQVLTGLPFKSQTNTGLIRVQIPRPSSSPSSGNHGVKEALQEL